MISWRPIDFQGIIHLDYKMIEQLEQFLQEKETRLSYQILDSLDTLEKSTPSLPRSKTFKLDQAIEEFGKHLAFSMKKSNLKEWGKQAVHSVHQSLWEFVEILQDCVMELFQQVQQITIDRWHISLIPVVHAFYNLLSLYLTRFLKLLRDLEVLLNEHCKHLSIQPTKWFEWSLLKKTYLDPALIANTHQAEQLLKIEYQNLTNLYENYRFLGAEMERDLEKMKTYPALAVLELADQNLYIDVFRFLKMRANRSKKNRKVCLELTRSLKYMVHFDDVMHVFRLYYQTLKNALINISHEWKTFYKEASHSLEFKQKLETKVKDYHQEFAFLLQTIKSYRYFLLQNAAPIRSRFRFLERSIESVREKKLLARMELIEELNGMYHHFLHSMDHYDDEHYYLHKLARQEIDHILHEMGQPLISQAMMRKCAERLLKNLQRCDELGSPHVSSISYVQEVLLKAMHLDWKYHVLHESALFHKLYRMHKSLASEFPDPSHAIRLERFEFLFDQIEQWMYKGNIWDHIRQFDLDLNDIKSYLQDFLASIQRAVKEKSQDPFLDETIDKLCQQLLEYRYIFGQFFLNMVAMHADGLTLRYRFLFVDQYFESVEHLIHQLKNSLEGKAKR